MSSSREETIHVHYITCTTILPIETHPNTRNNDPGAVDFSILEGLIANPNHALSLTDRRLVVKNTFRVLMYIHYM